VREEGRSGTAGAVDDVVEEDEGVGTDAPAVEAVEVDSAKVISVFVLHNNIVDGLGHNQPEFAPAIPPLSHGFGGDTVAILSSPQSLCLTSLRRSSPSLSLVSWQMLRIVVVTFAGRIRGGDYPMQAAGAECITDFLCGVKLLPKSTFVMLL
jgi:hypothetical protein